MAYTFWKGGRGNAPRQAGERGDLAPVDEADLARLPDSAVESWICGADGAVRILDVPGESAASPTVVWVHGLAGRAEQWAPTVAALAGRARAVLVDLPGHGGSDPPRDGDYSPHAQAAAIAAAVDDLGLRRFVLGGHSFGALVALEYAVSRPARLAGLLLVDPAGDQSRLRPDQKKGYLGALADDAAGEIGWQFRQLLVGAPPAVIERVLGDLEATSPGALEGAATAATDHAAAAALQRFPGSVRALLSDFNDSSVSLHRVCPELPAKHLPGTGHWLMMERPAAVAEAALELAV